jgi:hypothetical protein
MNSPYKQLSAWLVICSHMLVSCSNPYTGISKQSMPAVEKPAQETSHLSSSLALTTADNQPIYLRSNQETWHANLQQAISIRPLPFRFLADYSIQDLAGSQPHIPNQLLPIVYSIEGNKYPSYLIVEKQAQQPDSDKKTRQSCLPIHRQKTSSSSTETKLQDLANNNLNCQLDKLPLELSIDTGSYAKYFDLAPQKQLLENIHSATLWTQGGHKVKLEHRDGKWMAQVNRNLLLDFSQALYLPVYVESGFIIETLLKHGPSYQKHYIDVCFPKQDYQRGLGYVYIGRKGLLGGGPAKATTGIDNILVKHQGPFNYLQPTDDRIMVKEVQFTPQMGFWWAEITYSAYSNSTKRYKKEIVTSIRIPVETDQLEPFYAEDIARALITIHYSVNNPSLARPVPTFHSIKITKSALLPSVNKKSTPKVGKPGKEEITETEDIAELELIEKAAYATLVQSLNNPLDSQEIITNTQQQLQEVINRLNVEGPNAPLEAEAKALRNYLVELIKMLKNRHKATNDLYFGPHTSDYINQQILQGFKELNKLEQNIQSIENSLKILCHSFHLEIPSYNLELPVNLKALLGVVCNKQFLLDLIDTILETKVPAGQLIQIVLGHVEQPQNWEEWLPVGIETALDFIPRGKATLFLKLLSGKGIQTEFRKLVVKQAKKKAKQLKQANKNKKKREAAAKEDQQGKHP